MYINPKLAIENGWISGVKNPEIQCQPNAIDFTVDRLFTIDKNTDFIISEDGKQMRSSSELNSTDCPGPDDCRMSGWELQPGTVYDGMSDISVDLPEGVACELIIRSTFNRNGLFLTSGLYDSGYKGPIGFALHNRSGKSFLAPGTRIGQIKFIATDKAGLYAGGYNHDAGTHWSEES